MKMKRRDHDDADADFSDFPLCCPAGKIRRLDAELPPVLVEYDSPMRMEPSVQRSLKIEELHSKNEDSATVLFNPVGTPLQPLPSSFSVSVDPQIFSGLKKQLRWLSESSPWRLVCNDEQPTHCHSYSSYGSLAVVPWAPSYVFSSNTAESTAQTCISEPPDMMDVDASEVSTMDVEDGIRVNRTHVDEPNGADHLCRRQHQHCLSPQQPHSSSTSLFSTYKRSFVAP